MLSCLSLGLLWSAKAVAGTHLEFSGQQGLWRFPQADANVGRARGCFLGGRAVSVDEWTLTWGSLLGRGELALWLCPPGLSLGLPGSFLSPSPRCPSLLGV